MVAQANTDNICAQSLHCEIR